MSSTIARSALEEFAISRREAALLTDRPSKPATRLRFDAEHTLLSCIFAAPERAAEFLGALDAAPRFIDPAHCALLQAIREVHAAGCTVSATSVTQFLDDDRCDGATLTRIATAPCNPANFSVYLDLLQGSTGTRPKSRARIKPGSSAAAYLDEPSVGRHVIEPPRKYSPPPLNILPPVLRNFVLEIAKSLDVDVSFVLLPILSALAAAVGNSRTLRIKKGFVAPSILWTALVARSGSKKSPALSAATSFFTSRERELSRINSNSQTVFEKQRREWDAAPKRERGEEPQEPARLTVMLDDLTLAVVAPILRDNPRGCLVSKDELAAWLGSFGQFSQTKGGATADVSGWLSLFNGERLLLDRKTNRESHRIFHPRLSIAGCIPPSVLSGALTPDFFQRGLPARIFFAAPPLRPNVWTDSEVPAALENAVAAIFKRLFALKADVLQDGVAPKELCISPAALDVFREFYNRVGQHTVESGEREEAAWSKLTGGAARLALVGHLAHGFDAIPVSGQIMEAAVELAAWFGNEAERMYSMFAETPEDVLCRRLVEFIGRRGSSVTVKEVADNFRPLKNQTDEIERHLNGLVASSLGEWLPVTASEMGGRPTRFFRLFSETSPCPRPRNPEFIREKEGFADADTPCAENVAVPEVVAYPPGLVEELA